MIDPLDHLIELCCPISLELFRDPVATLHGNVYERDAIVAWFEKHSTDPCTGERLPTTSVYPDLVMRERVREYRAEGAAGQSADRKRRGAPQKKQSSKGRKKRKKEEDAAAAAAGVGGGSSGDGVGGSSRSSNRGSSRGGGFGSNGATAESGAAAAGELLAARAPGGVPPYADAAAAPAGGAAAHGRHRDVHRARAARGQR